MRQANSSIKGFLYQFDKALLEVLLSDENETIMLEGQIEDIDIVSESGVETIQCKYHEDKDFAMSNVVEPMLDMLCHFATKQIIGQKTKYILYAYFKNNVDSIAQNSFNDFLLTTENKEILVKYFSQIFNISDATILELANKAKKTKDEKKQISDYFINNKSSRTYKVSLDGFFEVFEYRKAEQHEVLKERIVEQLLVYYDVETVKNLYYPNAFVKIASMSSIKNAEHRKLTKLELLRWLSEQKILLANKWMFEIQDRKDVLKKNKTYLSEIFSGNPDVRAFVFSNVFLRDNENALVSFIIEYVNKYYCKKHLQKPPIIILDSDGDSLMNKTITSLFRYQVTVNNGLVGSGFDKDSFINNSNCASGFSLKITLYQNITVEMLQQCKLNYLLYIGEQHEPISDSCFRTEMLGISSIPELRYLVGLDKTLTEGIK